MYCNVILQIALRQSRSLAEERPGRHKLQFSLMTAIRLDCLEQQAISRNNSRFPFGRHSLPRGRGQEGRQGSTFSLGRTWLRMQPGPERLRAQERDSAYGALHRPEARVNRRLDFQVYENAGAVRASERKAYPPGQANRRKKLSNYGTANNEKQKIKHYYGMREKQLRRYFAKARRMKGNTGDHLLIQCERRLDNAVRRAGFATTRLQARQGVLTATSRSMVARSTSRPIRFRPET